MGQIATRAAKAGILAVAATCIAVPANTSLSRVLFMLLKWKRGPQ